MVKKWPLENNKIVKEFFEVNFPDFVLVEEISHGPNWGVKYLKGNDITVSVKGDIGFSIKIIIDEEPLDLWRFNKIVNDYHKTSPENIMFQLSILKAFQK